jgi:CRP-like cAMP-binding protein
MLTNQVGSPARRDDQLTRPLTAYGMTDHYRLDIGWQAYSTQHFAIYGLLVIAGPTTAEAIARWWGCSAAAVERDLADLERDGLVSSDPYDWP